VTSAEDAELWEHSSISKTHKNVEWVKKLVLRNKRITNHKAVNILGISFWSVQSILKYQPHPPIK
jgi:hypothetical protein